MFSLIRQYSDLRESMLLSSPEAIYTHFNISNGFFQDTYLMTPTPPTGTSEVGPAVEMGQGTYYDGLGSYHGGSDGFCVGQHMCR
mmetsp:Transcript_72674/g.151797  ORF Transcript_72674/g.151797 Transcript_72674/m.151797 type:complete len:85 (-) Transcript_72674:39-293(-)